MRTHTVGSVSYLNALPLVEGLDEESGVTVKSDVPSRLLDILLQGRASVALCPIIDYQTSSEPLAVVPVGAIGSASTTLTVRVFSRRPLPDVDHIAVDGDSSTSVALLQVVLHALYGTRPHLTTFNHRPTLAEAVDDADAILLIGDKVVASAPDGEEWPYQLDLGDAWCRISGLPFVFAAWMTRRGTDLEDLGSAVELCHPQPENVTLGLADQITTRQQHDVGRLRDGRGGVLARDPRRRRTRPRDRSLEHPHLRD